MAKRLESLGALTQGDRKSTVGAKNISLSVFNFDTKYGQRALSKLLETIYKLDENPLYNPEMTAGDVLSTKNTIDALSEPGKRMLFMGHFNKYMGGVFDESKIHFTLAAKVW